MDNVLEEFLDESYENLDQLDLDLVILEKNPSSQDCLLQIFRTMHTLKGSSSFLDFSNLASIAHASENLLSGLRKGKIVLTTNMVNALLSAIDFMRHILVKVENSGSEGAADCSEIIRILNCQQETQPSNPNSSQVNRRIGTGYS